MGKIYSLDKAYYTLHLGIAALYCFFFLFLMTVYIFSTGRVVSQFLHFSPVIQRVNCKIATTVSSFDAVLISVMI